MKGLNASQLEQFNSEKKRSRRGGKEIMEQNQWKLGEEVILKGASRALRTCRFISSA